MTTIQKANHSKSLCMTCKADAPAHDALWQSDADSLERAWFCPKCFPAWYAEKGERVVHVNKVEGVVPKRYRIRHTPKERRKVNKGDLLKVNGDIVTLSDLAKSWLIQKDRFTSAPWQSPEARLEPGEFCSTCLIDLNDEGEKVKAKCKLPVRSTPAGPVNLNALRNAAARLPQTDAPEEAKRAAARKLIKLMRAGGLKPGDATLAMANVEKEEVEKSWEVEVIKADEEKRLLYGVALEPETVDSQNDKANEAEIEKAAHGFMIQSRLMDLQHKEVVDPKKATPVESYITLTDMVINDKLIKKGSWVVVTKIFDDEIWQMVKSGEIRGYSIRGFGRRKPVSN